MGLPDFPAAERSGEGDDRELDPFRVGKGEFVLAVVREPILLVGDAVVAPGAEPVARGIAKVVLRCEASLPARLPPAPPVRRPLPSKPASLASRPLVGSADIPVRLRSSANAKRTGMSALQTKAVLVSWLVPVVRQDNARGASLARASAFPGAVEAAAERKAETEICWDRKILQKEEVDGEWHTSRFTPLTLQLADTNLTSCLLPARVRQLGESRLQPSGATASEARTRGNIPPTSRAPILKMSVHSAPNACRRCARRPVICAGSWTMATALPRRRNWSVTAIT